MPYGLPSGRDLRLRITQALGEPGLLGSLFDRSGISQMERGEFHRSLLRSAEQSIDAFLEHRTEFISAGKLAIAAVLSPLEDLQRLRFAEQFRWMSRS